MSKIDLHMHSNVSLDGDLTPQDMINLAHSNGLQYISFTDHNNTQAYNLIQDKKDITIITGVELDCHFMNKNFHILAFFIDPNSAEFKKIATTIHHMELAAGQHYMKQAREIMGLVIDEDKLLAHYPHGVYTGEAICEVALLEEANKDNPYLQDYLPGGKYESAPDINFYWNYCAQDKILYYPIQYMAMQDLFKLLRKQNAFIVLAHPGNNTSENLTLLNGIVALGIDGIEVYSSYHTAQQIAFYKQFAHDHDLVATCGSDFHGKHKPHIEMGQCNIPTEEEDQLISFIETKLN